VYVKDEKQTRYNVEMQVEKKPALGKRSRYYQSQMDVEMLLTGEDYAGLPNTYVIFICDFDPIGEGKYRYTFRTKCEELLGMKLEDGRTAVFLNTHGKNKSEVPKELVTLLKYIREDIDESEREFHDSYVERLQKFIHEIKSNREMEERFMIFEEMLKDERAEGREEGLALGLENAKSTLLLCLQSFGTVSETICDQIQSQQELEVLKQWTKIAFQSKSLEEFEKKISL
jgi:predicted transposase/invertase (TIGR01784 family)